MKIVYNNVTGAFIGYGFLQDFESNPDYLEKDVADVYLVNVVWDNTLIDFVNAEPSQEEMSTISFLTRFTTEERIAIRNEGVTN
ncbi:hypothetical protein [Caudoviricetes sp.]|nr:hypothetical protein [Caudoviricetes sp.]